MAGEMGAREAASRRYKPDKIKWLLIAEAPPTALDRYFYFEDVSDKDFLFVELMKVLCQNDSLDVKALRARKTEMLQWLKGEGFFLTDVVEEPLPEDISKRKKSTIISANRGRLIERMHSLVNSETRVILIKVSVFELYAPLVSGGFHVVNDGPVEFPSSGNQVRFRENMTRLLQPFFAKMVSPPPEPFGPKPMAGGYVHPVSGGGSDGGKKPSFSPPPGLRVVVDGSNVALDGQDGRPSVDNIIRSHRQLIEKHRCSEAYVVVGPGQLYKIREDLVEYNRLKAYFSGPLQRYLIESPGGHHDDEFTIQIAFDMGLKIVTNDRFRDHMQRHPEIADQLLSRLVKYKMVGGQLIIPDFGVFEKGGSR